MLYGNVFIGLPMVLRTYSITTTTDNRSPGGLLKEAYNQRRMQASGFKDEHSYDSYRVRCSLTLRCAGMPTYSSSLYYTHVHTQRVNITERSRSKARLGRYRLKPAQSLHTRVLGAGCWSIDQSACKSERIKCSLPYACSSHRT